MIKVLGIIPARAGSKGIPQKNKKLLNGKPLLAYTAKAAQQSSLLSKIILSTDDLQTAEVGQGLGLEVPFLRPKTLAKDKTPTLLVVQHALRWFNENDDQFEAVCILQPTNPFRSKGFIDRAIRKFSDLNCDSLISVLKVPNEFNPHWVFKPDNNNFLKIVTGDKYIIPRRQELPVTFFRDGSVYITKSSVVLEKNSFYGSSIGYIQSSQEFYVNLDSLEDWNRAEQLAFKLRL